MAAAPAITKFVGGTPELALHTTLDMYEITFDEHEQFTIPALTSAARRWGLMSAGDGDRHPATDQHRDSHKNPGVGMVGAGILRAPEQCFRDALRRLGKFKL